jgi:hypothetical protein
MSAQTPAQTQITLRTRETVLKQFQENTNPATSNVHAENALILEVLLDLRDLMMVSIGGSAKRVALLSEVRDLVKAASDANGIAVLSEIRDLIKLPIDSHFISPDPIGEAAAPRGEPHEG